MPRKKTTVKKTKEEGKRQKQKQNVNVRVVVNSNNRRKTVRVGRSQQQSSFPQVIQVPQFIDRPTQTGFDKNDIINNVKAGLYEVVKEAKYNEDMIARRQNLSDQEPMRQVDFFTQPDPIPDVPKVKEEVRFRERESFNDGMPLKTPPSSPKIPNFRLDEDYEPPSRGKLLVDQSTSSVPFNKIDEIRKFLVFEGTFTKTDVKRVNAKRGREMMKDSKMRQDFTAWYNNR